MDREDVQDKLHGTHNILLYQHADIKLIGNYGIELMLEDVHEDLQQTHIDSLYSFIQGWEHLSEPHRTEFCQSLMTMASASLESISATCPAKAKSTAKILLYFLANMCSHVETHFKPTPEATTKATKSKQSSSQHFDWVAWRPRCLHLLLRALLIDPSFLWSMALVQDNFLTPIWKYTVQLLEERPMGLAGTGGNETALRGVCHQILTVSSELFNETSGSGSAPLAAALVDAITRYEHMASYAADICAQAKGALLSNVFAEIAHMNIAAGTTADNTTDEDPATVTATVPATVPSKQTQTKVSSTVKHIGIFLVALTELNAKSTCLYFPLVLPQLASDAHQVHCTHPCIRFVSDVILIL